MDWYEIKARHLEQGIYFRCTSPTPDSVTAMLNADGWTEITAQPWQEPPFEPRPCPYCGKTIEALSTDGGCMECYGRALTG